MCLIYYLKCILKTRAHLFRTYESIFTDDCDDSSKCVYIFELNIIGKNTPICPIKYYYMVIALLTSPFHVFKRIFGGVHSVN